MQRNLNSYCLTSTVNTDVTEEVCISIGDNISHKLKMFNCWLESLSSHDLLIPNEWD